MREKYSSHAKITIPFLLLLIPITWMLSFLCRISPALVEKFYSQGINKATRLVLSNSSNIVPFSIGELMVLVFSIIAIVQIVFFVRLFLFGAEKLKSLYRFLRNVACIAGVLYFLFFILWGANYYRQPFGKTIGLTAVSSSVSDLKQLCSTLIQQANHQRKILNDTKPTLKQLLAEVPQAYNAMEQGNSVLNGNYPAPKGVFFSKAMSYAGISGIYFPLTAEANLNIDIPYFMLPSTACHEAAHQRGFAREDEANFISYLACKNSSDFYFRYSGTCLAVIYAMNALNAYDPKSKQQLAKQYSSEVISDLTELTNYWNRFEGPIDAISTSINNSYLKANHQYDGVHSYGRMVDLLLAEQASQQ